MRQAPLISITAVTLIGLAGCASLRGRLPGGQDASSDADAPANVDVIETQDGTDPASTDGAAEGAASGVSTAAGSASTPPAADGSGPVGTIPLDLITSTNPNTRAQQVQRNSPDPFSLLPAAPTVERTVAAAPAATAPSASGGSQGSPSGAGAASGSPGSGASGSTGSSGASGSSGSGSDTEGEAVAEPAPPLPPSTTLARGVEISGVVQIGAVPYAIVRAPNEPTSRYVRAGQSLSNGSVLVKRIDSFPGVEPTVTLEQNGVEVLRNIDGGSIPADDSTETAQAEDAPVS
ncbi:MAG: hypothetical protein ACFB5Z_05640 [Elainellaceae cyanobacterium]